MSSAPSYYAVHLVLLSGEMAPEGPGWYVSAQARGDEDDALLEPVRVSVAQAKEVARAIEEPLAAHQGLPLHPFQVVARGTATLRDRATQELADAEAAAARIATIRRALQELEETG